MEVRGGAVRGTACHQGLTLVHCRLKREHFLWDTFGVLLIAGFTDRLTKTAAQLSWEVDEYKPMPGAIVCENASHARFMAEPLTRISLLTFT